MGNFRFSSRVINSFLTAFITLYYTFVVTFYEGISIFQPFKILQTTNDDDHTNLIVDTAEYNNSETVPSNNSEIAIMAAFLRIVPTLLEPIYLPAFIVPIILAYLICLLQLFLGIKAIQESILKMYKGEFSCIPSRNELSNSGIFLGSSHLSGYLVGFLIWGFFIIFFVLLIITESVICYHHFN